MVSSIFLIRDTIFEEDSMQRRGFLACLGAGAGLLSGCTSSEGSTYDSTSTTSEDAYDYISENSSERTEIGFLIIGT